MISQSNAEAILQAARRQLHLPEEGGLDEPYLGNLVRRLAPAYCPCSAATLKAAARATLPIDGGEEADAILDECIEDLVIAGDLLEIGRVATSDPKAKGTWLFAGPPSFFARQDGRLLLFGIAPDVPLPLPSRLLDRIEYRGYARILTPDLGENLAVELAVLGFLEQKESAWLTHPAEMSAASFLGNVTARRDKQAVSSDIPGLEILVEARTRRQWLAPKSMSGDFVGRRPQEFGAPLWCFVKLANGQCVSSIDLPIADHQYPSWRGCDFGWQLQLALNAVSNRPGQLQRRIGIDCDTFVFNFPLPLWASRRLELLGRRLKEPGALFAYELKKEDAAIEQSFLERMLWLETIKIEKMQGGHDRDD